MGVVGRAGAEEERNMQKKYPTRKANIRRKLVLVHWAKKIAQTPKHDFVEKITARPSSFKICK